MPITINQGEPSPSPTPIPTKNAFIAAGNKILAWHEAIEYDNTDHLDDNVTLQNLLDYGTGLAAILKSYTNE